MVPAYTYKMICDELEWRLKKNFENNKNASKMVGILFARPNSSIAKKEIISNLEYFHHRSGESIDFFCGGYGMYWESHEDEFPDQQIVAKGETRNWLFSSLKFNEFRKEIESKTRWQYSGSVDLLLTNVQYNSENQEVYLDFSSTLVLNLEKMISTGAIQSIEMFFEEIFRFAENTKSNNPTSSFSDKQGVSLGSNAFKQFLLSFLHKQLKDEFNKLESFVLKDVSL